MDERRIIISVANNRKSKNWLKKDLTWSEFAQGFETPKIGTETLKEYMLLPKEVQADKKDVGGFVGGELEGNERKTRNIKSRDIITLDLDDIDKTVEEIIEILEGSNYTYMVYSTRKHTKEKPRLRIVLLTDRTMNTIEYEPVARKVAEDLGVIKICDPTTFEVARLMFFPSICKDAEYVYKHKEAKEIIVDSILNRYDNWKDISEWPSVGDKEEKKILKMRSNINPPELKKGLIGAFCRVYSIEDAIDLFLNDIYESTTQKGRYTYKDATTSGGAVVYDNKYIYSHHSTDPIQGQLLNAWDLVRIHKFGHLDKDIKEGTPITKYPSSIEMRKLASKDDKVMEEKIKDDIKRKNIPSNNQGDVKSKNSICKFNINNSTNLPTNQTPNIGNILKVLNVLEKTEEGKVKTTRNNIRLILECDDNFKDSIRFNIFTRKIEKINEMPWEKSYATQYWQDEDDISVKEYIEKFYNFEASKKIEETIKTFARDNSYNPVEEYLKNLKWDGKERLETIFIDYLGAEDNIYTREVAKKFLMGAVARGIITKKPIKFDWMPILTGPGGIGKTLLLTRLGKGEEKWYTSSIQDFKSKDTLMTLQGKWIIEIGELASMYRAEINDLKIFLTQTADDFRPAFGHHVINAPRRCVFCGTSNDTEFLRDVTGDRRYWPIDCGVTEIKYNVYREFTEDIVDQIWAEAYLLYLIEGSDNLKLSEDAEKIAIEEQESHRIVNSKESYVEEYLNRLVPKNWRDMTLEQRRIFLSENNSNGEELVKRDKICVLEIWCECFGGEVKSIKPSDDKEIKQIMRKMQGWESSKKTNTFKYAGKARGYIRVD